MSQLQIQREQAIHLLRAGLKTQAVANELGRSPQWVRKCWRRYQAEGWAGLAERSRAPHRNGNRIPEAVRRAVKQARSELEAEAKRGTGLKYIGARAIRTRLKKRDTQPLPSIRTIERLLEKAGLTQPRQPAPEIKYPHLRAAGAQELCQVDHIPRYLQGGEQVYCFNALDVVSRYPTGQVKGNRRAGTAADFLEHVWKEMGIPTYTQVDNEACFIGGFRHPYVLGQCVRLALRVGTELVFSPVRHPKSNAYVERFHQDYQQHVWEDTYLKNPTAVQKQADHFFDLFRNSRHHAGLHEQTPDEVHHQVAPRRLPADFSRPSGKQPLYAGRVHFMRRVAPDETVSVLNVKWAVPQPDLTAGVWVTLDIQPEGARLLIYDQPPDNPDRKLLVIHPFPLSEPVLQHEDEQKSRVVQTQGVPLNQELPDKRLRYFPIWQRNSARWPGNRLSQTLLSRTQRLKRFFKETMSWRL